MEDRSAPMRLKLLTPAGQTADVGCDSVVLILQDDREGRGGGKVGVQPGHAPAVMALSDGPIRASLAGKTVLNARTAGGFASVKENVVSVITDSVSITE